MKNHTLVLLCLLLASCASVSKTYTANGEQAYSLNCSGTARGWDKCFKAAGDLCSTRGYTILDRSSEDTMHAQFNSYGFSASKSNERSMLIKCN